MTDKTASDEHHPAERVHVALNRAQGILNALEQLRDPAGSGYAVHPMFVIQAVAALETFVAEAQTGFADMCQRCDLTVVEGPAAKIPKTMLQPVIEDIFEASLVEEPQAKNFDELMRKLTAAEVFAQEQQSMALPGSQSPLLPLLRSLKEDLKRVRAA